MEKRRLGRTDIDVPTLCPGTMMFGDQINEFDAAAQMDLIVWGNAGTRLALNRNRFHTRSVSSRESQK